MEAVFMTTRRDQITPGLEQLTLTAIGTPEEIRRLRHAALTELCHHASYCPSRDALAEAVRGRFNIQIQP